MNCRWRTKYLPYEVKPQKKVKSALRKEAIEQDQGDLSNPSVASESDEEELEMTPSSTALYYPSSTKTMTVSII